MGFKVKIEGAESIELGLEDVISVKYETNTPKDTNARSKDIGATLYIKGKILAELEGDIHDGPKKIGKWSLVPAEKSDAYRNIEVEVHAAGQVVRKITFPNAFVIDYIEHYGDTEGIGTFDLIVRQKKDKISLTKIEGGYGI
ncbi:membrane-associated protease 1 [Clostridium bornimense]|uniref:membrane-associated protease 1 n=1 Tax=Clostridium bornimense TaxID=1216932 RepID=UPI001C0FDA90|nr:membrane-associated protease 1 [Clostridium bornimense]MBU5316790.1 membrane-associated protease 1 [Clostridium bornimense]